MAEEEVTMEISACSSCGRAIIWTKSPTGARLPMDAKPVNVYELTDDEPPQAQKVKPDPVWGPFFISHFSYIRLLA